MSETEPETEYGIYVYGIVRADTAGGASPRIKGIAGAPLQFVVVPPIAAVVSELPMLRDGHSLEEQLQDPDCTQEMVLEHYRVLQEMAPERTVLPMRFAMLFSSEIALQNALQQHCDGFLDALTRMDGAKEWGVKIFCNRSALEASLQAQISASSVSQNSEAISEGRAFFVQRKRAQLADDRMRKFVEFCVTDSGTRLGVKARAFATLKPQAAMVHGRSDEMVWNGAFLVATSGEDDFFNTLDDLRRENAAKGFTYEVGGPWPAFSFAGRPIDGMT
jgi:hypothetical protein